MSTKYKTINDIRASALRAKIILVQSSIWQEIYDTIVLSGIDAWLYGGMVRNQIYNNISSEICDIDILTKISKHQLLCSLSAAGIAYKLNFWGSPTIELSDGNHLDITSIDDYGATSIHDALQNVDFSVNAVAINLLDEEVIFGFRKREQNLSSYYARKSRSNTEFGVEFCKRALILEKYYKIPPSDSASNKLLNDEIIARISDKSNHEFAISEIQKLLNCKSWVTRGYARTRDIDETEFWDDLDVVTDLDYGSIIKRIDYFGYTYKLNYFGNPKILLKCGIKVDVWPSNGCAILDVLSKFSHNVDSIAFDLHSPNSAHCDKLYSTSTIDVNNSFLQNASDIDISYAKIKMLYLAVRHKYKISDNGMSILRSPIKKSMQTMQSVTRLAKEMAIIKISNDENVSLNEYRRHIREIFPSLCSSHSNQTPANYEYLLGRTRNNIHRF